ncbi:MAG: hypothetical protein MZU97_21590 [Bacillus subtilis]|nr:hypothetical protein [Bacillus subtilis]
MAVDEYKLHKQMMCIDLKSFYASVECSLLGLDPFQTPLVVADKARGGGSIVLAVSPYLKKLGVPGRCRILNCRRTSISFSKNRGWRNIWNTRPKSSKSICALFPKKTSTCIPSTKSFSISPTISSTTKPTS